MESNRRDSHINGTYIVSSETEPSVHACEYTSMFVRVHVCIYMCAIIIMPYKYLLEDRLDGHLGGSVG